MTVIRDVDGERLRVERLDDSLWLLALRQDGTDESVRVLGADAIEVLSEALRDDGSDPPIGDPYAAATTLRELGCSDGACVLGPFDGMHTNGGCACPYGPKWRGNTRHERRLAQMWLRAVMRVQRGLGL